MLDSHQQPVTRLTTGVRVRQITFYAIYHANLYLLVPLQALASLKKISWDSSFCENKSMTCVESEPHALAVYGSLQPGGPNEHILARLGGEWSDGFVLGRLEADGWGAKVGYPGIRLLPDGESIAVKIFTSIRLLEFWGELDEFEGDGYVRTRCIVETDRGAVDAFIYQLASS